MEKGTQSRSHHARYEADDIQSDLVTIFRFAMILRSMKRSNNMFAPLLHVFGQQITVFDAVSDRIKAICSSIQSAALTCCYQRSCDKFVVQQNPRQVPGSSSGSRQEIECRHCLEGSANTVTPNKEMLFPVIRQVPGASTIESGTRSRLWTQ
jgi:hypothetical protein